MTQYNFENINPYVDTGVSLSEALNNWKNAVESNHSGTSRPSYAKEGMVWWDSSTQVHKAVKGDFEYPVNGGTASILMYGGVPEVDCAGAILAAIQDKNFAYIPPGNFIANATQGNIEDLLSVLNMVTCDGNLTINIPQGSYGLTRQVVINSDSANRIQILGAATVSATVSGQVSVSGASKNYSVTLSTSTTEGISTGDYALIRTNITGTGDFYAHAGVWKISAVGTGTVTVINTHHGATFPSNTVTGGSLVVLKTVLQFSGCDGFRFEGSQPLGLMDRVALVGDWDVYTSTGTTGAHGIIGVSPMIVGGASSNTVFNTNSQVILGASVGISGWGEQGIAISGRGSLVGNFVASCSNRKRGFYSDGASFRTKYAIASGNGEDGFIADSSGYLQCAYAIASGNGLNGLWSTNNSTIAGAYAKATGNLLNGFEARGLCRLAVDSGVSLNNVYYGCAASEGGMVDADNTAVSGNGSGGFDASGGAIIDSDNSTSTGNTGYGYRSRTGSVIRASGCTSNSNSAGDYYVSDSILFESSGNLRAQDSSTGSTTNRVYNTSRTHYCDVSVTSVGDIIISSDGSTRQTIKAGQGTRISGITPTTNSGEVGIGTTTATTVGASGAASALPAQPTGYWVVSIGGTGYKVPYYNA